MTAEIAIINRQAIAIAADSAVTIGKDRVWKNSNKLFSLGPVNDIAIMIYGTAEFSGFPLETIIKMYRLSVANKKFLTVRDCSTSFASFIKDGKFEPDKVNRISNYAIFIDKISDVVKIVGKCEKKADFRRKFVEECRKQVTKLAETDDILEVQNSRDFLREQKQNFIEFTEEISGEVITDHMAVEICKFMYEYYKKAVASKYSTGIVIAGYGLEEIFPSIVEYTIDGRFSDFTRIWESDEEDCNKDDHPKSVIKPFAQSDIFHLFMEGIEPAHNVFITRYFNKILKNKSEKLVNDYVVDQDEKIVENAKQQRANKVMITKFIEEFKEFRDNYIVTKILDVVEALPKEEMADMALALVELTSLRRKVDSRLESVGGPVDVAIISKGDGLVWVQRKHYFDIEKNRDFLYRKFGLGESKNA